MACPVTSSYLECWERAGTSTSTAASDKFNYYRYTNTNNRPGGSRVGSMRRTGMVGTDNV